MPTGIFPRTPSHNKKISLGLKKAGHSPPAFKGPEHPNWKGGKIFRSGYIYVFNRNHPFCGKQGYVAEHRIIMEMKIGRFLTRREVVHHINGDKTDNRPENLFLCSSPGQHTKQFHPEVARNNKILNKGIRRSTRTEFKKGMIPWNKKNFG